RFPRSLIFLDDTSGCLKFRRENPGLSARGQFFRHAMSLSLVARQLLETWMPKEFLALVEWSTLRAEKISGISEAPAERRKNLFPGSIRALACGGGDPPDLVQYLQETFKI
ncbi:MAG: hypothetical protein WCI20_08145, partial [bacterium]